MKRKIAIFINEYLDGFMLSALFICVFGSISFVVLKSNAIASVLHKTIMFILILWLIAKFLFFRKKILVRNNILAMVISLSIIVFAFISVFIDLMTHGNLSELSFNYLSKYLLFVELIIFILLCYLGNFTKMPFLLLKALVILFATLCIFLFVLGPARTWHGMKQWSMLTLNFSNPNITALVLSVIVGLLVYCIFTSRHILFKIAYSLLAISLIFFIYLTDCRSALISMVLFFAFIFVLKKAKFRKNYIWSTMITLLPLIISCCYILFFLIINNGQYLVSSTSTGGKPTSSRFEVWIEAFSNINLNPFLGNYYTLSNGSGEFQLHNSFLDLTASYGFIVLVLVIVFISYILHNLYVRFFCQDKMSTILSLSLFLLMICLGIFECFPFYAPNGIGLILASSIALIKVPMEKSVIQEQTSFEIKNTRCEVLIINNVYDFGSTGKIVKNLNDGLLKKGYSSFVIYGRNKISASMKNVACIESILESKLSSLINKLLKTQSRGYYFMTNEILSAIKQLKPQIVHIHGFNDGFVNYKLLLRFLSKHKIKTVYTNHSEYMFLGNCGGYSFECNNYKRLGCRNCPRMENSFLKMTAHKVFKEKSKCFKGFDNDLFCTTSVSPWLLKNVNESEIFNCFNNYLVLNGTDIASTLSLEKINTDNLKEKSKKVILNVTPSINNPNKGFKYLLELAELNKNNNDVSFVVVSLEEPKFKLPNNIRLILDVKDQSKLASIYYDADISVILSKKETFSMPVIESLCCGTPVAGFEAGGPETIAITNYSSFSKYGDINMLDRNITEILNMKFKKNVIINEANNVYSIEKMVDNYIKIYEILDKRFGEVKFISLDI